MNTAADFTAFLHELGLRPRAVVADGRWHRCTTENHPKRKNGAYCLAIDGAIGWCQDWALHAEPLTWRPERPVAIPAPDPRARRQRQAEDCAERAKASAAAREFYGRCEALVGGHPYLAAHGLDMTGCRGLKVDREGWLVVPMLRDGAVVSVQRIAADGSKRFWPGAPTRATRYEVERRGAPLTVLCEGLATGLALFAAVPTARVVVAFTSGNLPRVAETLPRRGMAVVAADNDHATRAKIGRNPGIEAANEAAATLGCDVAVPEGIEGSDFADLRRERIAERAGRELYGSRRESEASARRAVDAEIARTLLRAARYLPVVA